MINDENWKIKCSKCGLVYIDNVIKKKITICPRCKEKMTLEKVLFEDWIKKGIKEKEIEKSFEGDTYTHNPKEENYY